MWLGQLLSRTFSYGLAGSDHKINLSTSMTQKDVYLDGGFFSLFLSLA
jgi:hypothetical protein